jgi:molecular chaperone GrpE
MTDPNTAPEAGPNGRPSGSDAPSHEAGPAAVGTASAHPVETEPGDFPEGALEQRLVEAETRAAEYHEMALRARAEMENLRKRGQLDVAAAHKYANEGFAESLLPVRDSLEMALKVETPTVENLCEGVEATLRLLSAAFDRHKLMAIDPVGEKFDPNRHQAISMVPAGDVPPNHVVSVLQKGYLINDRVLRPALVTVRGGT